MKISFVIPAYNEEKNIVPCLQSIQTEIDRVGELVETEMIVVNNASTDRTKELVVESGLARVVDETRKGLVFARSAGFTSSTGELIANIDADTRMPEGWLSTVIDSFQDPELMSLSGPYIYYDVSWKYRAWTRVFYTFGYVVNSLSRIFLGKASMVQGGNFIVTREALEKIGGFDTTIVFYGEDTDIGRRVSEIGKVVWTWKLPMYTSGRRLQEEGMVKTGITYALNYLSVTLFKKPFTKAYSDIRP